MEKHIENSTEFQRVLNQRLSHLRLTMNIDCVVLKQYIRLFYEWLTGFAIMNGI